MDQLEESYEEYTRVLST